MAENSFQPFTRRQTMIRRDFEIYRYRYMDEVELHHHDFYEIYMLLRGSVSYTVENRIFHMRAGDLMLISPLELHQARVDSNDEPYERIVLWVDRGYLESLSSPHTSLTRCFDTTVPGHTNLLRLPGPRSAEMRRELDKLRSLHMQESYGSDLLAVCSLVELMVAINQSAADRSMQSALSADMASDRVVDGVLSYINEHYSEALTLDALADMENTEQIQIVGFDSGEKQQKAIQEGREYGTVTQNPYGLGYAAIVAAVRAIQGLPVDQKIDTGYQWLDKDTIDLETNQKYLYN